jgi:hypothetical protein
MIPRFSHRFGFSLSLSLLPYIYGKITINFFNFFNFKLKKVAVLDILCEEPYCLIDGRTADPNEEDLDADQVKPEDDSDSDKEEEDDLRKLSMFY